MFLFRGLVMTKSRSKTTCDPHGLVESPVIGVPEHILILADLIS